MGNTEGPIRERPDNSAEDGYDKCKASFKPSKMLGLTGSVALDLAYRKRY
jgi:hypothetical protein